MPTTVSLQEIETTIAEAIAEIGPDISEIKRDATLETLDVDSLDLVEVAQVIEEEFGVRLVVEDAESLRTVGDVYDLVYARASQ
jgi:acyl carrier protein